MHQNIKGDLNKIAKTISSLFLICTFLFILFSFLGGYTLSPAGEYRELATERTKNSFFEYDIILINSGFFSIKNFNLYLDSSSCGCAFYDPELVVQELVKGNCSLTSHAFGNRINVYCEEVYKLGEIGLKMKGSRIGSENCSVPIKYTFDPYVIPFPLTKTANVKFIKASSICGDGICDVRELQPERCHIDCGCTESEVFFNNSCWGETVNITLFKPINETFYEGEYANISISVINTKDTPFSFVVNWYGPDGNLRGNWVNKSDRYVGINSWNAWHPVSESGIWTVEIILDYDNKTIKKTISVKVAQEGVTNVWL